MSHFDEQELNTIMDELGVRYNSLSGVDKVSKVDEFLQICEKRNLVPEALQVSYELAKQKINE